jgi:hypothetical protein
MATKRITIDFWRVGMPDGEGTFEAALQAAASLPDDEARALVVQGAALRLQSFASTAQRREGDMMRIRMDEVPVRASLAGEVEVFDFEDDEGVGEETGFLYIPALETLIVQRNRFAVSASRLVGYFQAAADLDGLITLEPVVEPATASNFKKLNTVRRFEVKVAGVHNAQTIKQANPGASVKKMADLINDLSAINFNFEATMGHDSGSLDVQAVKNAARNLIKVRSNTSVEVKKIEISGASAGDEKLFVDLLRDRMVERPEVELDSDRRLPYAARKQAFRDAYQARKSQLQALFATGG